MPTVHRSPYFVASFDKQTSLFDRGRLLSLVADFIIWKETGRNPSQLTDKSSAKDDRGRFYRPYQDNNFRHTSLRFSRNGDPVIAFRTMPNGDTMLVCITTKSEMFGTKKVFRQQYKNEFPNPKPKTKI